jgi:hypothetical protein
MGQFSIWHWVVLLVFAGLIYWMVREIRSRGKKSGADLHGVRGWLLFFLISMTVISPLVGLGRTASAITSAESQAPALMTMENWVTYKSATWLLVFGVIIWQWYVAFCLTKHQTPSSVAKTKLFLASAPGLLVLGDMVLATTVMNVSVPNEWIAALVKGYLASAVWYAYFARSRRVKNTYGLALPPQKNSEPEFARPGETVPEKATQQIQEPLSQPSLEERLQELKRLFDADLITRQEYESKRTSLIKSL